MKILITSALPYANGPLHFGHIAGAYLPGDCYARFQRLRGNEVLYLCGSDEHGVAITLSADLARRTPKEHVDLFHEINRAFFAQLGFSFDHYSRTTWPGHVATVQAFYFDLVEKGLIEERTEDHLYSEQEGRFLADRYVIGTCPKCGYEEARGDECQRCAASYEAIDLKHPRSKLTGSALTLRPSNHLYLRFDHFKEELTTWIKSKSWKSNVLHFAMRYIEELKPRAITRDSDWGIPVPGMPNKVFYVWFDAPIGYISAAREWAEKIGQPDRWKEFWLDDKTKLVEFIGKDNIPFHAVFFPAMIMGQNSPYKLPDEIPANEFYLLEGRQFSKSEGWTIDLEDFFTKYTADQIRYSIAANAPETSDSEFSWKDFQMRCNAELLGKFGNFVHRVLVFAKQRQNSHMPERGSLHVTDEEFAQQMSRIVEDVALQFEHFHLRKATQTIMELAHLGNAYFDARKPWALAKDPSQKELMDTCIVLCIECIKHLSIMASPIIPEAAQKIWEMIGFQSILANGSWQIMHETKIPTGQQLADPTPLFRKIEDGEIEQEISKLMTRGSCKTPRTRKTDDFDAPCQSQLADSCRSDEGPPIGVGEEERRQGAPKGQFCGDGDFGNCLAVSAKKEKAMETISYEALKETIAFEQFDKMDIRVVQVLEAVRVPKSKKLLKLTVDLGFEKRTIVSGIALQYEPEQLVGKKVLLLANLAPATLLGIESQGMILAAGLGSDLELPMIQTIAPGSTVS